jgi:hypothetical protein
VSLLADVTAALRDSGATAEVVRDTDEGGFAWAELGELAAGIDYSFDDERGTWLAHVTFGSSQVLEHGPSTDRLHGIVLRLLQTESTAP